MEGGLTLEGMRTLVRRGVGGADEVDMPDSMVDEYLNMSLWDLEARYPFKEKECVITAPLLAGVREYGLPSMLDAIINVSIIDTEDEHKRFKLHRITFAREGESPDGVSEEGARGFPIWYHRRNWTLVLTPVPDVSDRYIVEVTLWRTIASLIEGSVDTVDLPRNWHELVVEGAITRAHFYNEDYNLAQQAANFQIGKVRAAVAVVTKEEKDARYARLRVMRDDPESNPPRRGRRY